YDPDRGPPAGADADAAGEIGPRGIGRVTRVEKERGAVCADDPELELGARDEQISPADARPVLVLRPERLIRIAAHAAVAAGVEALRRRQLPELRRCDRAVLAAQQHAHALAERADHIAAQVQPAERRPGPERIAAAAQIRRPRISAA